MRLYLVTRAIAVVGAGVMYVAGEYGIAAGLLAISVIEGLAWTVWEARG